VKILGFAVMMMFSLTAQAMLGAAGIGEAALCWLLLTRGLPLPPQDFSQSERDDELPPCGVLTEPAELARPVILSNSFAFGGNNACLILGRYDG